MIPFVYESLSLYQLCRHEAGGKLSEFFHRPEDFYNRVSAYSLSKRSDITRPQVSKNPCAVAKYALLHTTTAGFYRLVCLCHFWPNTKGHP